MCAQSRVRGRRPGPSASVPHSSPAGPGPAARRAHLGFLGLGALRGPCLRVYTGWATVVQGSGLRSKTSCALSTSAPMMLRGPPAGACLQQSADVLELHKQDWCPCWRPGRHAEALLCLQLQRDSHHIGYQQKAHRTETVPLPYREGKKRVEAGPVLLRKASKAAESAIKSRAVPQRLNASRCAFYEAPLTF